MSDTHTLGVTTLLGTRRPDNYTGRALALVHDELRQSGRVEVSSFDPARMSLAFPGEDAVSDDGEELRRSVAAAAGVIIATPEYHGCFSAVTKLMIENLGFPSELRGKPVALLGVAAGRIGAIKSLEALRGVCAHVGAIVLPGSVSIAGVQQAFDAEGNCLDEAAEKQIRKVATTLIHYVDDHVCPKHTLEQMARQA